MKNSKGMSLIVLIITIIILIILAGTITFSVNNVNKTQELDNLYSDLQLLKNKVEAYYIKYGKLPVTTEYTQVSNIPVSERNPNDSGKYYVIDINSLQNLTLRTSGMSFIINEDTHTIYTPVGVTLEGVTYYKLPQ